MMVNTDIRTANRVDLVVAFFDLTGFLRFSRSHTDEEVYHFFDLYYELVGDLIVESGGTVIKFMGDAGLVVFPAGQADRAVESLCALKTVGDRWLSDQGAQCRQIIKAHVGPVVAGALGTRTAKGFDVIGETVNTAATLPSHGLALTAELFRKLSPGTRKRFKKHTPPVRYIPLEESHQD